MLNASFYRCGNGNLEKGKQLNPVLELLCVSGFEEFLGTQGKIPRDEGGSSGPASRKTVGSRALWVHICLAGGGGRKKAAGSSAELKILVTHSNGGGS